MINLGCTKNLVDSQFLLGKMLVDNNVDHSNPIPTSKVIYTTNPYDPEVERVFLNTCGFISSGREEAFQTIQKLLKKGKKVCIT
ncbi:MAG: hypothetical protein LBG52_00050 [Candidatus Peribacteria bacterium]|nr:hypothetical protein [Candidatus Peribacteria bacterium]